MDKFSELKAAALAAVPGPWHVVDQACRWNIDDANGVQVAITQQRTSILTDREQRDRTANAIFIAAANPAAILDLLAELEAKDKRISTVTEEREFWRERVEGAEKEREEFRRRFNLERSCLEDADKRITALDMRNAELNSTIERWATDRAESASRIDELEAKLATPVRLKKVDSSNVPFAGDGFNAAVDYCAEAIRSAGFWCEGDE